MRDVDPAPGRRAASRALPLAALAAGLIALPWIAEAIGDPSLVTLATRIVVFAIAAGSLNLILGYGGLVSFGHAAYVGIGAYAVGILFAHAAPRDPLWGWLPGSEALLVTLPAAVLLAGLASLVIGALCLRTRGVQFIMITLAFAQMLFFLFVSLKVYGGDDGLVLRRRNALPGLNLRDDRTFYWLCLGLAAFWFGLMHRIVRSRFGAVLAAIRQNERRVAALGVSAYPVKLAAFVIAGMGAGLAGALLANLNRFVSPETMHWSRSGELMIMVILGGAGTLLGPLAGAAALIGLETWLAGLTEHWAVILGPLLVVAVLLPKGWVRQGAAALRARLGAGRGAEARGGDARNGSPGGVPDGAAGRG